MNAKHSGGAGQDKMVHGFILLTVPLTKVVMSAFSGSSLPLM